MHTKGPETLSQLVNYINETDSALQAIENSGVEYTGPPMPPLHQLLSSRYNCLLSENVIMRGAQVESSEGGDQLRSAAGEENELDRAMVNGGDDASLNVCASQVYKFILNVRLRITNANRLKRMPMRIARVPMRTRGRWGWRTMMIKVRRKNFSAALIKY